jgi:hypothetical protein
MRNTATKVVNEMLTYSLEKTSDFNSSLIKLSNIYHPLIYYEPPPEEPVAEAEEEDVQAPMAVIPVAINPTAPPKTETTIAPAASTQLVSTLSYKAPDATSNSRSVNCLIVSPF